MSNMLDAGHQQMIRAAIGINWLNNITYEEAYAKSGLLPFSQAIRKRRLLLISHSLRLLSQFITPLGSIRLHHSVVSSVRREQDRTWTIAKNLLNDLNAIDCYIDDVINFSSSQFTSLDDSFNSNFDCYN